MTHPSPAGHPELRRDRRARRSLRVLALASLLGLAAWGTAGCGTLQLTAINTMARFGDYELSRDVAYGPDAAQRLDVYVPDVAPLAPPPIVVFFHGGNWRSGDKAEYRFVGEALASRGILAVLAETRLHPRVTFPMFLDDAAQAVVWIRAHAAELGGDPGALFLMGHSSGAHMGAMLLLDAQYLERAGGATDWIAGFIGLAGPYDFSPTRPDIRDVFATVDDLRTTQPIQYAAASRAPMLLMHGEADDFVQKKNAVNLAAAVSMAGGKVETRYYGALDHRTILGALSIPLRGRHSVLHDIARFVAGVVGGDTADR